MMWRSAIFIVFTSFYCIFRDFCVFVFIGNREGVECALRSTGGFRGKRAQRGFGCGCANSIEVRDVSYGVLEISTSTQNGCIIRTQCTSKPVSLTIHCKFSIISHWLLLRATNIKCIRRNLNGAVLQRSITFGVHNREVFLSCPFEPPLAAS